MKIKVVALNLLIVGLLGYFSITNFEYNLVDESTEATVLSIEAMLDDWHLAASEADFNTYFSFMADSSIFMGTDASEYWDKTAFMKFSQPYFDRGRAWSFTPVSRNVYLNRENHFGWFDETLDTPNLGPARGSGVVQRTSDGTWEIVHYNLSIPIPNAIVDTVVQQISTWNKTEH